MRTLTLTLLILCSTIFVVAQPETRTLRKALQGQSIRFDGGGWTFQANELLEIDIVSSRRSGNSTIVEADIRTADAPGHSTQKNGRPIVTVVHGRIRVTLTGGVVAATENISLTRSEVPLLGATTAITPVYTPPLPTYTPNYNGSQLVNEELTVGAGAYSWKPFYVSDFLRISGRLQGSGGDGKYEAYIMSDQQLTNYRNGRNTQTFWSSGGQVVVADINTRLRAGLYYLVINNKAGWVSRNIQANIYTTY